MAMDWFKGSKASSVTELIVRKDYAKAIELISAEVEKNKRNERLRVQLAHVLALAGRKGEAADVLDRLADDLARDGFATKAVAVLKKMQKLDPNRSGIDERLAALIGSQPAPTALPWVDEGAPAEIALDLGEPSPVGLTDRGDVVPPPERLGQVPSRPATQAKGAGALGTPLFRGMSPEEIAAVIRGIRLLSFGPGSIVVTEGEPGTASSSSPPVSVERSFETPPTGTWRSGSSRRATSSARSRSSPASPGPPPSRPRPPASCSS